MVNPAPYILYGGVAVILVADAALYLKGGKPATITAWIQATKTRSVVAAFGIGVLFGHLFL